jgi:hypothetical protein
MIQAIAFLESPEVREAPELVKQYRCYDAEPREDERGQPVVPAYDDTDWSHELDDYGPNQHEWLEREAACLLYGRIPVDDLIQTAEREQHD